MAEGTAKTKVRVGDFPGLDGVVTEDDNDVHAGEVSGGITLCQKTIKTFYLTQGLKLPVPVVSGNSKKRSG